MKHITTPLQPGVYYHIYNRGNNRENLFIEKRNYAYFLDLYTKHIELIADTYAYCLLKNHFHMLVRIKSEEEFKTSRVFKTREVSGANEKIFDPSQRFGNLFNAYTKAINKSYARTGSLFDERFGRIPITNTAHLQTLIFYTHYNPQKHGFVDDFRTWPWSSYQALMSTGKTRLKRDEVLQIFWGCQGFKEFHNELVNERLQGEWSDEEFEDFI